MSMSGDVVVVDAIQCAAERQFMHDTVVSYIKSCWIFLSVVPLMLDVKIFGDDENRVT